MRRSSHEVAAQAIIRGTLGFRASLDVTESPRSATLCTQLLPWLELHGLGDRVEDSSREILQQPHGSLSRELYTDAFWRGEEALFLGWTIQWFERPSAMEYVDPGVLVKNLRLFQPTSGELISSAVFRPQEEIQDFCALCIAVRQHFQLSHLEGEGLEILKRIHRAKIDELGLREAYQRLDQAELESLLNHPNPNTKGLYVVRAMTAEWLLGENE